jgi:CubicO group peptidase (beta-lactamase class C family)
MKNPLTLLLSDRVWKPTLFLLFFCFTGSRLSAQVKRDKAIYPTTTWQKVNPKQQGWSPEKLNEALKYAQTLGSGGLMVIQGGKAIVDWGKTAERSKIASVRKSLLSALYGIHVQAGGINLDMTLEKLGIDDNSPALTAIEKKATVRMLLQARSGIYHNSIGNTPATLATKPERESHEPNTFWYYNNWDFNALGTIFEQQSHVKIANEFQKQLAMPLQMQDFRTEDFYYSAGEESIHPAYHFRMSVRDLARFGYLYLRQGKWQGKQLISADWVKESTKSYSNAGDNGGYGYLWWIADHGKHLPGVSLKDGSYSARGAGGKYIIVIPDRDLVVVYCTDIDYPDHATRLPAEAIPKGITNAQMGQLLHLLLEARPVKAI